MSWPRPPKLIRNSTPTTLISVKIRPSRTPTKMVGSAAGNRILTNCWVGVSLRLRPTLIRTRRVPDNPSTVFRITAGTPATKPIMMMVFSLRPKITRNSGYISTVGAEASAATQVSVAIRSSVTR